MVGAVVFWKAEKGQAWTYFESVYFSYTTLLTIGYGDFQTISNSSKPFFVFWTLLAVPTLTILISNMGDTVIQLIKDLTIWLGEVTVLPSDSGSIRQSLKFGLTKLTGGKINVQGIQDSNDNIEDTPPGLIHMPHRQKQESRHNKKDLEAAQRLASAFEKAEELDEDEARRQGDQIIQDIHHYRHILITEVMNVYADVNSPKPKKYTYEEWSYFLKLLGEDEGDQKYHRKAPMDTGNPDPQKKADAGTAETGEEQRGDNLQGAGQNNTATVRSDIDQAGKKIKRWSWMGNRSPLMGDKEEAEWILEKLFIRLEVELIKEKELAKKLRARKEKETGEKRDAPDWPVLPAEDPGKHLQHDGEDDRKTRASSRTLEGQFSAEEEDSRLTSSEDQEGSVEEGKDSRPPQT
jgi:potassium channel subfamily K, other eukaryote